MQVYVIADIIFVCFRICLFLVCLVGLCACRLRKLANFSTHSRHFCFISRKESLSGTEISNFVAAQHPQHPQHLLGEVGPRKSYELSVKCENKCALRIAVVVATKNKQKKKSPKILHSNLYVYCVAL